MSFRNNFSGALIIHKKSKTGVIFGFCFKNFIFRASNSQYGRQNQI